MATTINAGTATSGAAISADTTGVLQLQSGSTPTTAVTVDTSQNVGIGTTNPATKLQVNGNILSVAGNIFTDTTSGVFFSGANNSFTNGVYGVGTNNIAFTTASSERMRIDSSGNLLVGQTANGSTGKVAITTPNGATGSGISVTNVSGTSQYFAGAFYNNGTSYSYCGGISVSGSSTSYATSSDYRLKENIAPMAGALAKVSALKPVTYDWKSGGSSQGFIAHELQEVCPEAVVGEKDAVDAEGNPVYQGIDTSFLVATLTAAIQELNAKVDAQAAEIATLKGNA